jgi:hypothetical protein
MLRGWSNRSVRRRDSTDPADDAPAPRVDHDSQIETRPRRHINDVDHPELVPAAVVAEPKPASSGCMNSYTFPSPGEWPETRMEGRVDDPQEEAAV